MTLTQATSGNAITPGELNIYHERNRKMTKKAFVAFVFAALFFFGMAALIDSSAWARAGGGRSMGSRGGKGFSAPQMPSNPSRASPGTSTPGRNPQTGAPTQPSAGFFGGSPWLQGLAGGLAGGMIGSLLFGGTGHASPGGSEGGAIGFFEIAILALLLHLAYRFFKKRRRQQLLGAGYFHDGRTGDEAIDGRVHQPGYQFRSGGPQEPPSGYENLDRGVNHIKNNDPGFDEASFKETAQDLFFRIQSGWTNRSLDGIKGILTPEMEELFQEEFETMRQKGVINHLENIAIRKVELTEAWQETRKDYITVLIAANLLDYTVDATTREVVDGSRLNPVKFREFWTFCRDAGSPRWQLSAIHQMQP
jgi:predicted lipid-binding transport protein (Tim44 family)